MQSKHALRTFRAEGERGSERILVLAPAGRDAALVCTTLAEAGMYCVACADVEVLCCHLVTGAGAVVLTEEALQPSAASRLSEVLQAQPPWSDLPLILFVDDERRMPEWLNAAEAFGPRSNLTILGQPAQLPTLVTVVQLALRARRRQYEVRALVQHLEALNRTLERRVETRTADLQAARTRLQQEVEARQRLEQEILEVSTQERHRFAQDLHDGLCQQLTSLSFMTAALHARYKHDEQLGRQTAQIANLAERAIRETRALSHGLLPLELQNDSLVSAFKKLASNLGEAYGIACELDIPGPVRPTDTVTGTHLYRIAQEAISNAIRHGKARRVVIALREDANALVLEVQDDGVGIENRPIPGRGGIGLRTMDSRARLIGATLEIGPGRGGGTLVACRVPRTRTRLRDD